MEGQNHYKMHKLIIHLIFVFLSLLLWFSLYYNVFICISCILIYTLHTKPSKPTLGCHLFFKKKQHFSNKIYSCFYVLFRIESVWKIPLYLRNLRNLLTILDNERKVIAVSFLVSFIAIYVLFLIQGCLSGPVIFLFAHCPICELSVEKMKLPWG